MIRKNMGQRYLPGYIGNVKYLICDVANGCVSNCDLRVDAE